MQDLIIYVYEETKWKKISLNQRKSRVPEKRLKVMNEYLVRKSFEKNQEYQE